MSPAPKYRERTCNTKTEIKGVGDGVGFGTVEGSIYAVTEHVEGTGVAIVADGYGAEGLRFRSHDQDRIRVQQIIRLG
jgi:hypothetical protein